MCVVKSMKFNASFKLKVVDIAKKNTKNSEVAWKFDVNEELVCNL